VRKLLLILLALISTNVYANYSTPGTGVSWSLTDLVSNSGGVVTFSGGEYFLNDTLVISQSDTVKITTNGTFRFAGLTYIDVFGVMKVTPPDSFKITAIDTNQKFYGLKFNEFSDPSLLSKVIMEYGNSIRLLDCDMTIDNCILRYNTQSSSFASGTISLFRSNAIISNNTIFRNRRSAIQSGANIASAPIIENNLIYDNNIDNANVPQINFGQTGTDTIIIRNNVIRGGTFTATGGIAFLAIGTALVKITDNVITNNRFGLAFLSGGISGIVSGNRLDSNNIDGNPNTGGSGINFAGTSTNTVIISNNTIRYNLWGITIQGTAKPNIGNLDNTTTVDDGGNHIHDNGNTGQIYDLYNNTPDSIKAENNYWGTGNIDTVEAHIFHKPDNASLGFVDYLPIESPLNTQNNSNNTMQQYYLYDSYPNPFNPISTMKFHIPRDGFVSIKIYDLTGREIHSLLNSTLRTGTYQIQWNASSQPSGVYFVRLQADGVLLTKKIVLTK
jgi:hypothetical protein